MVIAMDSQSKIQQVEHALDGNLEPLPDYGDLFTLEDFVENCKSGGFIDSDGTGYYSFKTVMSRKHRALPSEIDAGKIDKTWTHVMWFNK